MYGPGSAPPQPRPAARGLVIGLRVLFVVLPVVTLGAGAWGSMLRLALVLRRPLDWVLTPVVAVVGVGGFVLVGISTDDNSWEINVGVCGLLLCMFATPVYFLIMDIRGVRTPWPPRPAAPAPPHPQARPYAHPYASGPIPQAAPPGTPPGGPGIPGRPAYGYGVQAAAAPAGPAPSVPPAGPRIHQVRAELDELSDFLRKEEGR